MNKTRPHIITALTAIAILILSLGDFSELGRLGSPVYNIIPNADKLFHMLMYFILTMVMLTQYRKLTLKPGNVVWLALGAFIYGVLIEFMQRYLTQSRSFEKLDIFFNLTGIILGVFIYYVLCRILFKNRCPDN
jgi:glycopeptide antibiotics resistance protein